MRLIITIENHLAISIKLGSEGLPECLETGVVCDDVAVVTPEIVRVDDGIGAFGVRDIVHD